MGFIMGVRADWSESLELFWSIVISGNHERRRLTDMNFQYVENSV